MATEFYPAPAVEEIARPLIAEHHAHLNEWGAHIEFVFRDDTPTKNGREVWGVAKKISGLNGFLARSNKRSSQDADNVPFFVIVISRPAWNGLNEQQRIALVDHELMHCVIEFDKDGEPKLALVGHDFEGFTAEINRYDLWRKDAERMAAAMQEHKGQPSLPLGKDAEKSNTEVVIEAFERGGKKSKRVVTSVGAINQLAGGLRH